MLKPKHIPTTCIQKNDTYIAIGLEEKLRRRLEGASTEGTDIDTSIPLVYTERDEGVQEGTNIRTDRFEVARIAIDKINRAHAEKYAKAKAAFEREKTPTENDNSDAG